ncbi:MAG TPA: hypothetical protein VN668_17975 [Stellaceae bacterium]|nr:hypothetical protein [Stellaceae bacterium]
MPISVAQSLRRQAKDCLDVAKKTNDESVRNELLAAAVWLHEEALKIERLLGRGGGGPSSPSSGQKGERRRSVIAPRRTPRRHKPQTAWVQVSRHTLPATMPAV